MHPGEVLQEEFFAPQKMSAGAPAEACALPAAMRRRDAPRVASAVAADINRSFDIIREVMFTADAAA